MDCPKCGASNAPLKKSCYRCGTILSGYTINNVTGEAGYRNPDGTFTKEPKSMTEEPKSRITDISFDYKNGTATVTFELPIGRLIHEPTRHTIAVYKTISRFKRFMLRWCFGLKFERI